MDDITITFEPTRLAKKLADALRSMDFACIAMGTEIAVSFEEPEDAEMFDLAFTEACDEVGAYLSSAVTSANGAFIWTVR